ncbi:ArsR/SmtB family transcription factor [Ornithinimicrobium pratense]|uniref:Helix-turn-helix transcriptional regulator n=1 Tax=Ornithinimicrobium pratense TaxID=2593973 RepID=A0A5J6V214_9MICO|nr:helix-turn-helix domain-containing protein [Ornithinimicrobium pratense]QFG67697.1 helix-turn-helix transcriptional regulator [Ornithinimicrobium pratense]
MPEEHPPAQKPGPPHTVALDARSARGLAHPLRLKILGWLRTDGPATATMVGAALGLNTGATSYHLRQLATYGFVVEDPERGTPRERWWRAAHSSHTYGSLEQSEGREAFVRAVAQTATERIQRAAEANATLPEAWRAVSTFSDWVLRLTPREAQQLRRELAEVFDRYRRHDPEDTLAPQGSVPFAALLQLFPHHPERLPDEP